MVHNIEELLSMCSRSIVAPDMIITEANRIMSIMNDHNLEQKFIVQECEALSLLASSFVRSGYDFFIITYTQKLWNQSLGIRVLQIKMSLFSIVNFV